MHVPSSRTHHSSAAKGAHERRQHHTCARPEAVATTSPSLVLSALLRTRPAVMMMALSSRSAAQQQATRRCASSQASSSCPCSLVVWRATRRLLGLHELREPPAPSLLALLQARAVASIAPLASQRQREQPLLGSTGSWAARGLDAVRSPWSKHHTRRSLACAAASAPPKEETFQYQAEVRARCG